MWKAKRVVSFQQQRDKIATRLNRKATRSHFPDLTVERIKAIIPKKKHFGFFKGSSTYAWRLSTTGPSQTASNLFIASDDGRIFEITLTFPAGSEFQYYIQMTIDQAVVFPDDLSQNLRGDIQTKTYQVDIPFQRGSRIEVVMISDATLAANEFKECWVDLSVKYLSRVRGT